jgi:transposase
VTESCEDDQPHWITHVETTAGPIADGETTTPIHQALERKDLLPKTHLVDTGYLDADLLVSSQRDFAVDLFGPTRHDYRWQAKSGQGFQASNFPVDWERQQATYPAGRISLSWSEAVDRRHNRVVKIKFSMKDCQACPSRQQCTRGKRRTITLRRQEQHLALQAARVRETSADYEREYARRAGIDGTLSQGIRACGLRRSRYLGAAKTHLQHVLTATAINLVRIGHWLMDKPVAKTRTSAFENLMKQAVPC